MPERIDSTNHHSRNFESLREMRQGKEESVGEKAPMRAVPSEDCGWSDADTVTNTGFLPTELLDREGLRQLGAGDEPVALPSSIDKAELARRARAIYETAAPPQAAAVEDPEIWYDLNVYSEDETPLAHTLDDNQELFDAHGPTLTDVQQGDGLGDCWLLAALAAVADTDPQRIRDMIRETDTPGVYEVRFYRKGEDGTAQEVWIPVDADFVRDAQGREAYAQTLDGDGDGKDAFWVALVEKAAAKFFHLYVSNEDLYMNIDGGLPQDSLYALTGLENDTVEYGATDAEVWQMIERINNGESGALAIDECDIPGLLEGHVYTLLGGYKDAETGEIYLRVSDPYGRYEPGDGNDKDGVFVIPLSELNAKTKTTWSITVVDEPDHL